MGRKFHLVFGVLWTGFIWMACLTEGSSIPKMSFFNIPNKDKIAHFIFYFVLSAVWFQYLIKSYGCASKVTSAKIVFTAAAFMGITVELLQYYFTKTRSAEWADVFANCLGSLAGLTTGWILIKGKRKNV